MAKTTDTRALVTQGALPFAGMSDIADAGTLLAQASFLGCKNPGEGFVLMATCQQTGMSLIQFQQKYHFRQGRFSIQAHALLAEFVERGGAYKIVERSPVRAALELTKDGNTYVSEVTWEQALQEPFVYRGDESDALAELTKPLDKRKLKAKYQTPRARMQMLWARALSDGVVVVDPGARGGIYTPEETEDFAPALPAHEEQSIPAAEVPARVAAAMGKAQKPAPAPAPVEPVTVTVEATITPVVEVAPDPNLCPIPGKMLGVPWTKMETDILLYPVENSADCPEVTPAHLAAIKQILAERHIMGEG